MNWPKILAVVAAIYVTAILLNSALKPAESTSLAARQSQNLPDPVLESFERELNREPVPAAPVRREAIDGDELYRTINSVAWSPEVRLDAETTEDTAERTIEDE